MSSWVRCRNIGLDPYSEERNVLTIEELKERIHENKRFINFVSPFLQIMADNITGSGFRVDLYDAQLILLKKFGHSQASEIPRKKKAHLGLDLNEVSSGTNTVSLASLLEKPVQLIGPEHYRAHLHKLACCAVPIKDENGKIIAIINAVGDYWMMHKHTMGMMIALGKSIEHGLYQQRIKVKMETTNRFNEEIIEVVPDALVFVDTNCRILRINKTARNIFGIGKEDFSAFPCDKLWRGQNPFQEVLQNKAPILYRETSIDINGDKVKLIATLRPIVTEDNQLQGVIGIFKEMQTARKILKHFAGWKARYTFADIVGKSPEIRQAIRLAKETAKLHSNILIQGESGTGKDLFAQAIHNESLFGDGPFVVVNCAAIPYSLLESELFGYEEGAFTGAKKGGQPGKFELAEGGTIFLDEINSMPLDMQAKILRVLQNKTIIRVGGSEPIPVNVRIITATNKHLWQMVKQGEFREDLFFRINVISILIPPLRERLEDLEMLIDRIMDRIQKDMDLKSLTIDTAAVELMKCYDWPGNIRELENVLERSSVQARTRGSSIINREDLLHYSGIRNSVERIGVQRSPAAPRADDKEDCRLKSCEREIIQKTLLNYHGNMVVTSKKLGISRSTLYRKIKQYGLKTR